jgi:hypothetical protein
MQRLTTLCALVVSCALAPAGVWAHGGSSMLISSTADGGGALQAEYDFSAVSRLSFSASLPGPVSVYTGVEPAFDLLAADEPLEPSYVLDDATQVSVEITAIDAGKTAMKIGATVLSAVGDSVVLGTTPFPHTHPELQLLLTLPEGEFGEGSVSFKLTTPSAAYGESEIYTLKLSNGPLAPLDYDAAVYAAKSVLCQQTVGAQVRTLINKELGYLKACLDKVAVYTAKAALTTPPPSLGAAQAAAEKACANASGTTPDSSTMLGKIAKAKAAASTAIKKRCGTPNPPAVPNSASGDLSDDDISQHLGLAGCRVEELAAAAYGGAKPALAAYTARASQGGNPLDQYFPCLIETAAP